MIFPTASLHHYPARPCCPQGGFGVVMMMKMKKTTTHFCWAAFKMALIMTMIMMMRMMIMTMIMVMTMMITRTTTHFCWAAFSAAFSSSISLIDFGRFPVFSSSWLQTSSWPCQWLPWSGFWAKISKVSVTDSLKRPQNNVYNVPKYT